MRKPVLNMQVLSIVLPVFIVIGIGYLLGVTKFITEELNSGLSKIVFYIASPALLFRGALYSPVDLHRDLKVGLAIAVISFLVAAGVYVLSCHTAPARRGVLAQGAFRSNTVFVGLPIITNAFGDEALGKAAVIIGFTVLIYIIASVLVLSLPHQNGQAITGSRWLKTSLKIVLNPLVVASGLGSLFSWLGVTLLPSLDQCLKMIAEIAMPVALLSVGASLNIKQLKAELQPALLVSFLKLIVYPIGVYLFLRLVGLEGNELRIPVLIMATPTAVLSYIMAREMKGDERLASAIVIGTTIVSPLTITAWLVFFQYASAS